MRADETPGWESRRRTRVVLCTTSLLLLVLVSIASPGSGAVAENPGTLEFGAINRIVGTRSAVMLVRVPRDAYFSHQPFGANPDVTISGAGRLLGLVLTKDEKGFEGPAFFAGKWHACSRPGCSSARPESVEQQFLSTSYLRHKGDRVVLPAGDYRLFLIADGSRAEVMLRLHGLEGTTTLFPTKAARAEIENPTPQVSAGPYGIIHSAGRTRRLEGRALGFVLAWSDPSGSAFGQRGICVYRGMPPVPGAIAYLPSCGELGAAGAHRDEYGSASGPVGLGWVEFSLTQGRWSQGGHAVTDEEGGRHNILLLWLAYA